MKKFFGHTWDAPITIGDQKGISIANIAVIKKLVTIFSVCHYGLAISIKKYLEAKEELWKF
jgi:hypothetical protein